MASGAAVDRYESDRQRHRAVFKLLDTTKDKRAEEESGSVGATTVAYGQEEEEEEYDDEYYQDEYEDGMSGDYDMDLPQGKAIKFVNFLKFLIRFLLASLIKMTECNVVFFPLFFFVLVLV